MHHRRPPTFILSQMVSCWFTTDWMKWWWSCVWNWGRHGNVEFEERKTIRRRTPTHERSDGVSLCEHSSSSSNATQVCVCRSLPYLSMRHDMHMQRTQIDARLLMVTWWINTPYRFSSNLNKRPCASRPKTLLYSPLDGVRARSHSFEQQNKAIH